MSTARMTITEQLIVQSVHERQKILSEKKLCFNCTGTRHRTDECRSKLRCQICDRKHHTSIYHKQENKTNPLLVATGIPTGNVTYPVVVVEVEGIKTESARRWSNNWTKTLYQNYLHCIANFCRALLIIFSKQFISSNTKRRKRMLNFV